MVGAGNGTRSLMETAGLSKASPASSHTSHQQSPPEGSGPVPVEIVKHPPGSSVCWMRLAGPPGTVCALGLHTGDPVRTKRGETTQ